jgi:hypothetical protein
MVDGVPIKPISPAEHRRLDNRIKKKYERLRRRYPEVHGKKVDWISHWHEDGYLSFNVRFTDGKNFSILCTSTIVTNVVDFYVGYKPTSPNISIAAGNSPSSATVKPLTCVRYGDPLI